MCKVLITGANGFIGTSLSLYLFKIGYTIYSLDLNKCKDAHIKKAFLWEEINDIKLNDFDFILHLAGKAHDLSRSRNDTEYFDVNYGLTKLLIDRLNGYGENSVEARPVFIMMSSVKACLDKISGIMTESTIPMPVTPYGKSKLQAEEYIRSKYGKHYILRSCMVHGYGNLGNFNRLIKYSKLGLPWPLGAFENKRSFISISNLCYLIRLLLEKRPEYGVYIVADDSPISTNDLMALLWKEQRVSSSIINVPKRIVRALALLGDCFSLPLNTEMLSKLTETYIASNDKIKRNLDVKSLPFSTEEGFIDTIRKISVSELN